MRNKRTALILMLSFIGPAILMALYTYLAMSSGTTLSELNSAVICFALTKGFVLGVIGLVICIVCLFRLQSLSNSTSRNKKFLLDSIWLVFAAIAVFVLSNHAFAIIDAGLLEHRFPNTVTAEMRNFANSFAREQAINVSVVFFIIANLVLTAFGLDRRSKPTMKFALENLLILCCTVSPFIIVTIYRFNAEFTDIYYTSHGPLPAIYALPRPVQSPDETVMDTLCFAITHNWLFAAIGLVVGVAMIGVRFARQKSIPVEAQ